MPKPKLSARDIDRIVSLLTSWRGKLTWELLLDKTTAILGRSYTRQALDAHDEIKRAFKLAKERVRTGREIDPDRESLSSALSVALNRVENLRAEVTLLKEERSAFLETFAIWLYNARNRGISEHELNRPLPAIERHRSDRK